MCWKATVREGLKELHTLAKGGNVKAKYLIALTYPHQGRDVRRTAITIIIELRRQLTAGQMGVVCYAIID